MRASIAFTILLLGTRARAEPNDAVEGEALIGQASTPFDVMTLHEAKGQGLVLAAGERHAVSPVLVLDLRVPIVLASVAQPASSYVDEATPGNPQLGARYRLLDSTVALTAGLDVGAPIAGHDRTLIANRALAIANGIEGLAHPELFTPGVLPVTPHAELSWARSPWTMSAELRIPVLVRVSDADMPAAMARTNAIGLTTTVAGEARRQLSPRLALAAAAQLFADFAPSVEHVRAVSRLQDLERLTLDIRLGSHALLALDLQTAIGGELGGSMFAGGLRSVLELP
jgi:hypothetical protein